MCRVPKQLMNNEKPLAPARPASPARQRHGRVTRGADCLAGGRARCTRWAHLADTQLPLKGGGARGRPWA